MDAWCFTQKRSMDAGRSTATSAEGTGTPVKITPDDASEWHARVSPDGKLVAFVSDTRPGSRRRRRCIRSRAHTRNPSGQVDAPHARRRR
jgi:hypothetical protein